MIGGVGTTAAPTVVFAVWAHLDGQTYPCRLQADFTGHERILGRDVLNRLDILFRGPQQEVISPVLCTMVLDGLEQALHEAFSPTRSGGRRNQVHLVRYADDFIITGISENLLKNEVRPLVEHFLAERGLELSHEKTRITHLVLQRCDQCTKL